MKITRSDHGKTIELPKGADLVLELEENPTTGYRWQLLDFAPHTVAIVQSEYRAGPGKGAGAGGLRCFHLELKGTGTIPLRAKLLRAWEGDNSILERFEATLLVK